MFAISENYIPGLHLAPRSLASPFTNFVTDFLTTLENRAVHFVRAVLCELMKSYLPNIFSAHRAVSRDPGRACADCPTVVCHNCYFSIKATNECGDYISFNVINATRSHVFSGYRDNLKLDDAGWAKICGGGT